MQERILTRPIRILLFLFLLVSFLVFAKSFLVPMVFAVLFSMLLMPISLRFEAWGLNRGLAILVTILLFLSLIAIIITVLVWQISDISEHASAIEQSVNAKLQQVKDYITNTLGISQKTQAEIFQNGQQPGQKLGAIISGLVASLGSFVTNFILFLVYIFLFLYYRTHLKKYVLMLVPPSKKHNTQTIMEEARGVAQKYIAGISWMIACLWVMYSIAFSIVGVNNAVFYAILCGLLEIVPFVGNITGNIITIFAVVMQGGSTSMILGVIMTYALVQFLQTYILEPLVVGKGVSINPLFTITGIVAGELIWGIPGMILAIPVLGIAKIVFDHIDSLKPYGFLIGSDKQHKTHLLEKVKKWGRRKVV